MGLILNYIDLIWIPVAFFVPRPRHRWIAVTFMILCSISLRLSVELIHSTGHIDGFIPFLWSGDVRARAVAVYGVFSALYLMLLYLSPRAPRIIVLSAGIVLYIAAFSVSMLAMAI